MKLEVSRRIFEKYPNIKFGENPFHWEPSFSMPTDGWTDRQK
jgi:hypothetical protein